MARPSTITYEMVEQAAQKLLQGGHKVTAGAIRAELGTGSVQTIGRHLMEWSETRNRESQLAKFHKLRPAEFSVITGVDVSAQRRTAIAKILDTVLLLVQDSEEALLAEHKEVFAEKKEELESKFEKLTTNETHKREVLELQHKQALEVVDLKRATAIANQAEALEVVQALEEQGAEKDVKIKELEVALDGQKARNNRLDEDIAKLRGTVEELRETISKQTQTISELEKNAVTTEVSAQSLVLKELQEKVELLIQQGGD